MLSQFIPNIQTIIPTFVRIFSKMRKYGFEDLDLVFNRLFKQAVVRRKLLKAWPSKGKHPINFPTVP
ncbi:hypothetical protein VF06_17550 [Nostoc linckia z4]|uniref:Uncharacterized protein n=1 Tax=Nostoc linckia z8 TaxID=1628746 RepID=A0A9Q5Z9M0_NOSLI|nr:hypothetical protein VF05_22795 [Nostoc linckia z3]PHJ82105.1 hypothetical protein VF06_17550 [Nostoc linckia z4]PHK01440.1 hypothetical protein VF08_22405 [Nostoc linckia z8]